MSLFCLIQKIVQRFKISKHIRQIVRRIRATPYCSHMGYTEVCYWEDKTKATGCMTRGEVHFDSFIT